MKPRVSIGVPVFNGERHIAAALDSLLEQTFDDFEIIISDNGSTDSTPAICQDYARADARIHYHQSDVNRGASWNFNRTVELATAEYFRWAAHDDVSAPDHLARCVSVLDERGDVVLCTTGVSLIDDAGALLGPTSEFNQRLLSDKPHERFGVLTEGRKCYEIFGLIRTSELRRIPPLGSYGHADGVLLARLGLLGRFYEVPEPLFFERIHPNQSMNVYGRHTTNGSYSDGPPDYHAYIGWFNPDKSGKLIFPYWRILAEHVRSVATTRRLALVDRLKCVMPLMRFVRHQRYWLRRDLSIAWRQQVARLGDRKP